MCILNAFTVVLPPAVDAALRVTVFEPSCAAVNVNIGVDFDETKLACATKAWVPLVNTVASVISAVPSEAFLATMT